MITKEVRRANEIEAMLEIIDNVEIYQENSENGLVILLNSAWGTGKTTFLQQLEENVNEKETLEIFSHYNAYEYDSYENAYIPLFSTIAKKIKLESNTLKSIVKSSGIGIGIAAEYISKSLLKHFTDIDLEEIGSTIKAKVDEIECDYLKDFEEFDNTKKLVKEKLREACKRQTQVFIVDELDRCKPNFAMETLEIIKHFFDVPNCIFIIAVDKIQLEESAKIIYGAIDSEKYFSKLFDYQFNLLPLSLHEIVETVSENEIQFVKRASEILSLLNISLRDSKKIVNEELSYSKDWSTDQMMFMLFLYILKYTDLTFYNAIINGEYNEYSELIKNQYDASLHKYKKVLNFTISNNYTYDAIIRAIGHMFNKKYKNLYSYSDNVYYSLGTGKNLSGSQIAALILQYLPVYDEEKSVRENLKGVVR